MANVTNLSVGSSGSDVKKLQEALINAGYDVGSTGADGVLGKNTEAAIKQYQKDNGLTVDGIAGKNTQGLLYGTASTNGNTTTGTATLNNKLHYNTDSENVATTTPTSPATPSTNPSASTGTPVVEPTFTYEPFTYDKEFTYDDFNYDKEFTYDPFTYDPFSYGDYAASDAVNQANALLQQHISSKPGEYQSAWQDEADSYLSQYQNRGPFSYDFNSDALYQQYKDNYIQQGQMAMMDTMGQAAAMTGGYGNSYAQTVGQQVYNQQLSQLNNIMPELYQMAYDRYTQQGQELLNMYGIYMDRDATDYGRYRDKMNDWYNQRDYLTGQYNSERDFDYGQWKDDRNFAYDQYSSDRNLAYDQYSTDKNLAYDMYADDKSLAYDMYADDKNLAYDMYADDKQMAYDDYLTGRSEAFSDYQTKQSQAFTSSENEKDRAHQSSENEKSRNFTSSENDKDRKESQKANAKSYLIDLITSTGYTPTDAELEEAGMTRSQADSYASAYSANAAKSVDDGKKTTMSYEDQEWYGKKAQKAVEDKGVDGLK